MRGTKRCGREVLRRVRGLADGCDFTVQAGEVLGFFGLIGAGRSELMRKVYGADRHAGSVMLDGAQVAATDPAAWVDEHGEERKLARAESRE